MVLNPPIEQLYSALTEMVVLEKRIQRTAANLHGGISAHPAALAPLTLTLSPMGREDKSQTCVCPSMKPISRYL